EQFDPGRFLPERAAGRHKFAYFPFGGGPRVCIGNHFALMEGPLVLATIVQRFRVELVPGQEVLPDATFTLRPRNGVRVILRPSSPFSFPTGAAGSAPDAHADLEGAARLGVEGAGGDAQVELAVLLRRALEAGADDKDLAVFTDAAGSLVHPGRVGFVPVV